MTIAVKLLLTVALIFSIAVPFGAFAAGEKTKGRYKTALIQTEGTFLIPKIGCKCFFLLINFLCEEAAYE